MRVLDFDHCLEHLEPGRQDEYFRGLSLGAEVDLRGTTLSGELVTRLVDAVGSIDGRRAEFGRADFAETRFPGLVVFEDVTFFDADFTDAVFEGSVSFDKAGFRDSASFLRSRFEDRTTFEDVVFDDATFEGAYFAGETGFDRAIFKEGTFTRARFAGAVCFDGAVFKRPADFIRGSFDGRASFCRTKFESAALFSSDQGFADEVRFDGAEFGDEAEFNLLRFDDRASFLGAKFAGDAMFDAATFGDDACFVDACFEGHAMFEDVRFRSDARFRGAVFVAADRFGPVSAERLDFGRATFRSRMTLFAGSPEMDCSETKFEEGVTLRLVRHSNLGLERSVFGKASTVSGAASVTSVEGADVADLVFTDADLANCRFAGAHHLDKLRLEGACTFGSYRNRQVLAEEHVWRSDRSAPVGPRRIADLYRQLRKAQEDSKNEPGAADFYYGEMEMRRHSPATPWSERFILYLYWLISGYGLRALRALATLAVLIAVVSTSIWLGGFKTTPAFGDTLIYVAQSTVSLDTKLATLPKELTPLGEVLRLVMRVLGPLLLGLTLLAVRNRVKR